MEVTRLEMLGVEHKETSKKGKEDKETWTYTFESVGEGLKVKIVSENECEEFIKDQDHKLNLTCLQTQIG